MDTFCSLVEKIDVDWRRRRDQRFAGVDRALNCAQDWRFKIVFVASSRSVLASIMLCETFNRRGSVTPQAPTKSTSYDADRRPDPTPFHPG
jgi:hypothetical protein